MNTIENNKIIADFMGLSTISFEKDMYVLKWKNNLVQPKDDTVFKFHLDWNWIMEVVEKIENLEPDRFKVEIFDKQCIIYDMTENHEFINFEELKKIYAVYNSCLEFVKWYKLQKQ
jgi:hypothetical protein